MLVDGVEVFPPVSSTLHRMRTSINTMSVSEYQLCTLDGRRDSNLQHQARQHREVIIRRNKQLPLTIGQDQTSTLNVSRCSIKENNHLAIATCMMSSQASLLRMSTSLMCELHPCPAPAVTFLYFLPCDFISQSSCFVQIIRPKLQQPPSIVVLGGRNHSHIHRR